jgi:hypothetical protein
MFLSEAMANVSPIESFFIDITTHGLQTKEELEAVRSPKHCIPKSS